MIFYKGCGLLFGITPIYQIGYQGSLDDQHPLVDRDGPAHVFRPQLLRGAPTTGLRQRLIMLPTASSTSFIPRFHRREMISASHRMRKHKLRHISQRSLYHMPGNNLLRQVTRHPRSFRPMSVMPSYQFWHVVRRERSCASTLLETASLARNVGLGRPE